MLAEVPIRPKPTIPNVNSHNRCILDSTAIDQTSRFASASSGGSCRQQGQRKHNCVVGDLLGAVVRHIADRDALFGGGGIDRSLR
jgi:predicted nucleic acid-binding Zn ribbon protein